MLRTFNITIDDKSFNTILEAIDKTSQIGDYLKKMRERKKCRSEKLFRALPFEELDAVTECILEKGHKGPHTDGGMKWKKGDKI